MLLIRSPSSVLHLLSALCLPSLCLLAVLVLGCNRGGGTSAETVVVYTSVDEPVARPIIEEFTHRTGVKVELRTDTEANKSAGLAARLEAEKDNPRCDVWWGNEVFRTIRLAGAGVLAPYESPAAADIPPQFKDPQHRWAGSGLRVRVIGRYTGKGGGAAAEVLPNRSIRDLVRPELKGKVAIANPRAGTTSGQVAALYVLWGPERAREFFRGLRYNDVKVLGGNGDVADAVAGGALWVGLTDNDDVDNAAREGGAIEAVVPDQEAFGTLTIPCTAALVAGSKHPEAARALIDHLLSAETEKRLIAARFAAYSVRGGEGGVKTMRVDYAEVAKVLPEASDEANAILTGRGGK